MSSSKSHGDNNHKHSSSRSSVLPPPPLDSPSSPTSDQSTGFLKIPRIRLKPQNKSQKQQSSSPPQQQQQINNQQISPTDSNRKNNKFSYIENSHLVNPVMIREQQQKMVKRKELEKTSSSRSSSSEVVHNNRCSDGDEEDDELDRNRQSVGIKPKKLPNPIKESVAMQSIHRELLLNQKIGRSVLTHKTELQKALEKLATKNVDSDNNDTQNNSPAAAAPNPPPMMPLLPNEKNKKQVTNKNKNEFQRILDARAKQIEDQKCFVDGVTKSPVINESEFEKMHKRITAAAAAAVNK